MEEYKPNSHKSKEEEQAKSNESIPEKSVEKVISGTAKTKKKSKLKEVFVSEDVESVKSYILMDVLVPAVKKAISDIVTNGIDMILYGENGSDEHRKSTASKISYRSYYDKANQRDRSVGRIKPGYNYDDILLDNRGEAEEVLTRMDELVDTYGMVSVADFYDLVGVTGNYTDNKYGWTDIRNASVVRTRDGYMIKLPKAIALN